MLFACFKHDFIYAFFSSSPQKTPQNFVYKNVFPLKYFDYLKSLRNIGKVNNYCLAVSSRPVSFSIQFSKLFKLTFSANEKENTGWKA